MKSYYDAALVLLYHGVPDLAHHHVTTEEELFKTHMKYLAENKLIRYFYSFYLQTVLPHGKHTLVTMQ